MHVQSCGIHNFHVFFSILHKKIPTSYVCYKIILYTISCSPHQLLQRPQREFNLKMSFLLIDRFVPTTITCVTNCPVPARPFIAPVRNLAAHTGTGSYSRFTSHYSIISQWKAVKMFSHQAHTSDAHID